MEQEFTLGDSAKDLGILWADGPQPSIRPPVADNSLTDGIQQLEGWQRLAHDSQRFQITPIGCQRDLGSPPEIGNALAQGNPHENALALSLYFPTNIPTSGIIDGRLDPQYTPLLVVHFDGVLIDPVFDAHPFNPYSQIALDFSRRPAIEAPLKETENLLRTEMINGVMQQRRIEGLEAFGILEQDIRRVFAFSNTPVIPGQFQAVMRVKPGVTSFGQQVQPADPFPLDQAVHQPLGLGNVVDVDEAIVALLIFDTLAIKASAQPLPPINADLNGKGKPGLQSHMHQAKFPVNKIEVQVKTLPDGGIQSEGFQAPVLFQFEGPTGLNAGQHADQSVGNVILFHHLPSDLLLDSFR